MTPELEQQLIEMGLAWRQRNAFYDMATLIQNFINFKIPIKRIFLSLMAIIECFFNIIIDTPRTPIGEPLDLSGYELVFCDDFEGDALNTDVWYYRGEGAYQKSFYSDEMVAVKDGKLILKGEYLKNGKFGEGWYGGSIATKQNYCGGYFEMRALLSECESGSHDFWSAFWISAPNVYNGTISKGGPGGCEIDIMESRSWNYSLAKNRKSATFAVWCNGYDDDEETIDGRNLGTYYINEPFKKYNTYGLKWTKDEYIWYINGVEAVRSSFPFGVSEVEEEVILSLAIPSGEITRDHNKPVRYLVDYVKIYQQSAE